MDPNSPPRLKNQKLNNSIAYHELEELVENDEEIRKHKLEIEMLKREQQKQLEKYMQKEIGRLNLNHTYVDLVIYRTRISA